MTSRDELALDRQGWIGNQALDAVLSEPGQYFIRQFDMAWKLASCHLDGLSTAECLWRPAESGLHVRQGMDDQWLADWPEHEGYDLGPSSIAWLTWHFGFWWSMVLDHSFGQRSLSRQHVFWPGNAERTRDWIAALHAQWRSALSDMTDADFASAERTQWPFQNRPFGDVVAWANMELTKSAAEIGYVRFLYAAHSRRP